jgi:hypothetical protein
MSPEDARALRKRLEKERRKQPQLLRAEPRDGRILCGYCNNSGKPCPCCGGKGFRQFPLPDEDG